MTASESRLPPRRVADRQQRDVQLPTTLMNDLAHELMRVWRERGVTGKEARLGARIDQIHVRRRTPAIERVPTPAVSGRSGVNYDATNRDLAVGWQRPGVRVSEADEPGGDRWRSEERDVARQPVEGAEGKVIGVRVRQQDGIEHRQVCQRD